MKKLPLLVLLAAFVLSATGCVEPRRVYRHRPHPYRGGEVRVYDDRDYGYRPYRRDAVRVYDDPYYGRPYPRDHADVRVSF